MVPLYGVNDVARGEIICLSVIFGVSVRRVDHQVRGDVVAKNFRPVKVHGVCIPVVNDVELAPEIAIHDSTVKAKPGE